MPLSGSQPHPHPENLVDPDMARPDTQAPPALDPLAGRRAGACVPVADDDPINQEVMRAQLEAFELPVDVAHDGAEALQMALVRWLPQVPAPSAD